jgi:hypothetical protein
MKSTENHPHKIPKSQLSKDQRAKLAVYDKNVADVLGDTQGKAGHV